MSNERRSSQPHSPATELAGVALRAFEVATADHKDARCIVLTVLPSENRNDGGIALSGYGNDEHTGPKAVTDLVFHVRAILRTMGKDLTIVEVPKPVPGGAS